MAERNDITKPLIAAVNGLAFGGGFEIALCCDIVVADERATFSMSEPRVGFVALGGGVQRLGAKLPKSIAMELLLTGRRMSAEEALGWGLYRAFLPLAMSWMQRTTSPTKCSNARHWPYVSPRNSHTRRWAELLPRP